MMCLFVLVGHLWTLSGCPWPPCCGSLYIEVSVSMGAPGLSRALSHRLFLMYKPAHGGELFNYINFPFFSLS